MTPDRQRSLARVCAAIAGIVILVCVAALFADYAAAVLRAGGDAERVAALQIKARSDASAARDVFAAQDLITRARRARKARSQALAILLIAAAGAFVGSVKWRAALGPRRPMVAPLMFVRRPVATATAATPRTSEPALDVAAPPPIDLSVVDRIIGIHGPGTEAAIPILQAIQSHFRYLPDDALRRVCERTAITPAQLAGTSSFYARFRRSPVGEHVIRVCHGTACHVSGARQISEELRRHLHIPDGADTDPRRLFTIDEVACLGCCSLAPVLMVNEHTAGRLTPATASAALALARQEQPA